MLVYFYYLIFSLYSLIFKKIQKLIFKFVDFCCYCDDNSKNKILIVNPLSDTFDYFVDDLLSSNANLLKGELDFLLMQDLFNSTDLKFINKTEIEDNESLAA